MIAPRSEQHQPIGTVAHAAHWVCRLESPAHGMLRRSMRRHPWSRWKYAPWRWLRGRVPGFRRGRGLLVERIMLVECLRHEPARRCPQADQGSARTRQDVFLSRANRPDWGAVAKEYLRSRACSSIAEVMRTYSAPVAGSA